ncbi:MAG: metallophosphoesterase [Myxococcota bacterium]
MKKLLLIALLAGACTVPRAARAPATRSPTLPQQPFVTGPYLLLGKPGQVFVAVKQPLEEPPVVEWWVDGGEKHRVTAVADDDLWVTTLNDLPIGPKISYRVYSSAGDTPVYRFSAGSGPGEPFRFVAFGDTRTGHEVHRAVVEAAAEFEPDFLVHTGDMVEVGGIESQWDLFFQLERPLLAETPIIPSIGNHDESARGYYRHYFLQDYWTKGRRYYAYDWGQLRIVSVDVAIECREGCAQYDFAEEVLADTHGPERFTLISLHFPPYSSGHHGSDVGVQVSISQLARNHGVELVIAGHDHNYERTKPIDGTTYVVSGSAGAPIREVRPREFTAVARTEPHFCVFDVFTDRIEMQTVNLDGEVFDTATLLPNPPVAAQ